MDYVFRRPRPKPLGVPDPKRISTPAGQRLSTIVEGAPAEPSRSHRLSNMSMAHRLHLGRPPTHDAEKQPPEYAAAHDGIPLASHMSSSSDALDWTGKHGRRGGWKRLAAILALVLAVIIALAVGLGVGLSRQHSSSSEEQDSSDSGAGASAPQPFPMGQWLLTTALDSVDTGCTSATGTWMCQPSTVYSVSPTLAETVFDWDIAYSNPSAPSNDSLLISSSSNPFLLMFSNVTLTLTDAGQASERYTFSLDAPKLSYPAQPLGSDGGRDVCYFNGTVLTASLYTRMPSNYDIGAVQLNGTTAMAAVDDTTSNARSSWPYAVQVNLNQPGGANVPDCYPITNNAVSGPRITTGLTAQPQSSTCSCNYANFNL